MAILDKFKTFAGSVVLRAKSCAEKFFGVTKEAMEKGAKEVHDMLGKVVKEYEFENKGKTAEMVQGAASLVVNGETKEQKEQRKHAEQQNNKNNDDFSR